MTTTVFASIVLVSLILAFLAFALSFEVAFKIWKLQVVIVWGDTECEDPDCECHKKTDVDDKDNDR